MDRWTPYAREALSDMRRESEEFRCNWDVFGEGRGVPYLEAQSLLIEMEELRRKLEEATKRQEAA